MNSQNKVDLDDMKTPKGCRVTIRCDEPGFADARVKIKFPHDEHMPPITIKSGQEIQLILRPWLVNQIVLEGLPREGDPEKEEDY